MPLRDKIHIFANITEFVSVELNVGLSIYTECQL